jgi:hypothetical protein
MASFEWKILEVASSDNNLEHIKYKVTAVEGDKSVETEGYAFLKLASEVSFNDLLEVELIEYLKRFYIQGDVNTIEFRLNEQLAYLQKNTSTTPPWHKETFKLEI